MARDLLHPAVARLVDDPQLSEVLSVLGEQISGADLTALLMEIVRRRAGRLQPSDVLGQYQRDRFVAPAAIELGHLRSIEDIAVEETAPRFTHVIPSPVVPLGTHSVMAGVHHQNNVITTIRASEVAADPTAALALEAAVRRRHLLDHDRRSSTPVRLAAIQRVVRAQRFVGPRSFAHFSLLGAVTAGRDVGSFAFESAAVLEHVRALASVVRRVAASAVTVKLTDFSGTHGPVIDRVVAELERDGVAAPLWPDRTAARGYYPNVCFKLYATTAGEEIEVGDGGLVAWAQDLLQSRKERLMTSGLSLERLVAAFPVTQR
ncbi:MAG: hypothetical protein AB7Q42_18070 [Acidimicrobiia bacterium]